MKKMSLLLLAACVTVATLHAQPGGYQRRTVEERVKIVQAKLDSAFKLDPAKIALVDTVFANYYRGTEKIREELMTSGGQRPDMAVMREKTQPLVDARDKELKGLLTDDQFKTWKEQIEPGMRPQRSGRN